MRDSESKMRSEWGQRQSLHGNQPRAVLMKGLHPLINATLDRWHKQVLSSAFAFIQRPSGSGPVLDLGCGYGRLAPQAIAVGLGPLVGLDFTPRFCVGFLAEHGPAVCGSLTHPPFQTGSLSAAYSITSLMYLPTQAAREALIALDMCLASGAPILILEPAKEFNNIARKLAPSKRSQQLAVDGLSRDEFSSEIVPSAWRFISGGGNPWTTLALPFLLMLVHVPSIYQRLEALTLRMDRKSSRNGRLPYFAMYRWALYQKP